MKRKIKYTYLIACVFGFIFFSCKKETQPVVYMGYDYFPNKVGHYIIYQCDSIIFDPYSASHPQFDTFQYQIKEVIDSIYPNNSGQATQRIVRYKRSDPTIPWSNILTPEKVWTGNLFSTLAQRQEDNYEYVKLVFPISLNKTWNGNAMNTLGEWDYQYKAINTPATINGTKFDSTITVSQRNFSTFLGYQFYYEQYAAGIGLVYREVIDYSDTSFISNPPSIYSASAGTIFYSETYLSSGNQ